VDSSAEANCVDLIVDLIIVGATHDLPDEVGFGLRACFDICALPVLVMHSRGGMDQICADFWAQILRSDDPAKLVVSVNKAAHGRLSFFCPMKFVPVSFRPKH